MIDVFNEISKELEYFVNHLEWSFIIISSLVLFGIKYKDEFTWFVNLTSGKLEIYRDWIAVGIVLVFFLFFRSLNLGFDSEYLSSLLRSIIIIFIFNSDVNDKMKKNKK